MDKSTMDQDRFQMLLQILASRETKAEIDMARLEKLNRDLDEKLKQILLIEAKIDRVSTAMHRLTTSKAFADAVELMKTKQKEQA